MLRRIIQINPELCNGCGICVTACHEGAIALIDNKAVLTRDDYCDGLGDCLPNCPTSAITFIEKDTLAYDDAAVKANIARKKLEAEKEQRTNDLLHAMAEESSCGCPGSHARSLPKQPSIANVIKTSSSSIASQLSSWPVQLQLVSPKASFFHDADLLIAADCSAYSYANFHQDFMKDKVTLIACPKLDDAAYVDKLAQIFSSNNIHSVTVVRMEVPCCGGLTSIVKQALSQSNQQIPFHVTTLSCDGQVL